jgi:hypothetical protein
MPRDVQNVDLIDGSLDFSVGVQSNVVTTVQSTVNPNGLPRNALAWLVNGTIRDGGIRPRSGWQPLGTIFDPAKMAALIAGATGFFQGGDLYQPENGNPYLMFLMGGHLYMLQDVDNPAGVVDLSVTFNLYMPANVQQAFFRQAEQFLIIQAGDYITFPLFWDGTTLRRSLGLTGLGSGFNTLTGTLIGATIAFFTVPAIGANVAVTLDRPWTGTIGDFAYFFDGFRSAGGIYSNFSGGFAKFQIVVPSAGANLTLKLISTNSVFFAVGNNIANGAGLISLGSTVLTVGTPEIPAAGPMEYYMGRLWYAQGRQYSAGDIVNGPSGTNVFPTFYGFRDSVLKVTENPLVLGGDGFTVPDNAGNIRAIAYSANLNTSLGQGVLYVFTRKEIYALQVPVTRNDWTGANANNMPLQYAVQINNGAVNDRSVVEVNGDLFFQTLQPSIQALQAAIRNFTQWGNVPISVNEDRILAFNDRSLLWAASGIEFDNRVLQTAMPAMTPWGVTHPSLIPLNFDSISTLNNQLPPAWEGQLTGLDMFQLWSGDFGGRDRAFALVLSKTDQSLQLWELTAASRTDNGDNRIDWVIEFPAFTWGHEFELKELLTLELWIDDLRGTVNFGLDYRPDSDACFYPWHKWKLCSARNSCENVFEPICYPLTEYGPGYASTITLPHPPQQCNALTGRPAYIGYQFQARLTIHGWCRIRGIFMHASDRMRELYARKVC